MTEGPGEVSGGRLSLDAYVDTTGMTRGLQRRVDASTRDIRAKIRAQIDERGTKTAARDAARKASEAAVVRLKVVLDERGIISAARAAAAKASAAAQVRINVEVNDASLVAARAKIEAAAASVRAEIDVEANATGARATIEAAASDALAEIDVDANVAGARARIAALRASEEHNPIVIPTQADPAPTPPAPDPEPQRRAKKSIDDTLKSLSKFGLYAGGIYTLGTAVVQLGGGLVALASSASQAVGVLAALPNLAGVAVQGIGALFLGFSGVTDAVGAMAKADQQAQAATAEMASGQEDAAQRIADARRQLANAEHQAADSRRQSARSISDAEWSLARAQEAALDAQKGLNEARQQAAEDIQDLNRELVASRNDETAAMNALIDAQEKLQDVKWDMSATSKEKRDAENAVKQAKDDLAEARDRREDLTKETKKANKAGVEGSDQVQQAKDRVRDSAHAEQQAEIALAEARHQAADAARASAEAIQSAQRGIIQAQEAAGVGATKLNSALNAQEVALAKLSPAGRRFARFLFSLKPGFDAFKASVQEALLPPVEQGLRAAEPLVAVFQRRITQSAGIIGRSIKDILTDLATPASVKDIDSIMGSNNRAMRSFTGTVRNLVAIFRDLAVVAGPVLVEPFAEWTKTLTASWRESVKTGRESGGLARALKTAGERAAMLGDLFNNLAGAIFGVGKAASGPGTTLLQSFIDKTAEWDKWANSDSGQKRMTEFFESTVPVTEEFGRLVGQLSKFLVLAGESNQSPLTVFLTTLTTLLRGLNALMSLPGVGQMVGSLMALAAVGGALGLVASALGGITRNLKFLSKITGLNKLGRALWGTEQAAGPARRALTKLTAPIKRLGTAALNAAKSGLRALGRGIKSAATAAGNAAKRGLTALRTALVRAGSAALSLARRLAGRLVTAAKAAGRALLSAARAALAWLVQAARTSAALAVQAARWVAVTAATVASRAAQLAAAAAARVAAAAQWLLNAALSANPIGLVVIALAALGAAFYLAWTRSSRFRAIVMGVWSAVQRAVSIAWNYYYKPILRALAAGVRALGAGFRWLWQRAIRPAWGFIQRAVQIAWTYYYRPIFTALRIALRALGSAFMWLWEHGVRPAWNAIKSAISTVWNTALKPIFTAMENVVRKSIPRAFRAGVDAVKRIWDSLKSIASTPVEFIVNTVYTQGIRKVLNAIPGVKDLPEVKFNGFATGGVLPGYTPGKDVHRFYSPTAGGLALSGGEGILVPEAVRALGAGWLDRINGAARRGGGALRDALHGAIDRGHRFAKGGIVMVNGEKMTPLAAAQLLVATRASNLAMRVMQGSYQPATSYSGTSHTGGGVMDTAPGSFKAQAWLRRLAFAAWARNIPGAAQAGSGAHVHSVSRIDPTSRNHPQLSSFARGEDGLGGRDYGPNPHPVASLVNEAIKMSGTLPAKISAASGEKGGWLSRFAGAIKAAGKFAKSIGGWVKNLGNMHEWGPTLVDAVKGMAGKVKGYVNDKIPGPGPIPSLFDSGGPLYPGSTLAINKTGKTETVFTNTQMVDLGAHLAGAMRVLHDLLGGRTDANGVPLIGEFNFRGRPEEVPAALSEATHALRVMKYGGVHAQRTP